MAGHLGIEADEGYGSGKYPAAGFPDSPARRAGAAHLIHDISFLDFDRLGPPLCCKRRGVLGGGTVLTYVEVKLTISVPVDAEYSPAEHADDIVKNVRRLFPAADVTVQEVETGQVRKPKRSAFR
ncbi:hypothetical protein [Mesorhizobium koreense]|uniref:hypothetical protein n=1 Tax=Mesorhizobium koreense TaxID=3074855 RepID=UPI00287B810C|nr:hypothetical protein [Mesorhizobium sp. WR6]